MTLERIEAAARKLPDMPIVMIEDAVRAAFPELFADPPTAWIAPWEASDAMRSRGGAEIGYYDPEYEVASEIAREVFRAFRDSHLSTLKGEKE